MFDAGMRKAYAALYSTDALSESERVALERTLASVPYRKPPQGELALSFGEPDA